ncbi:MAG: hypothetical protein ACLUFV_02650 [Acutalibacteraceae bacterium]
MEAGGNLVPDTDGTNGSPQRSVTIPAGGFLIAFGAGADERLKRCYDTAFEGAMLYNATMSVIYDVRGTLDAETRQLSIAYPAPEPETDETLKFLFVGNSTTYFNGTPLKFKAPPRGGHRRFGYLLHLRQRVPERIRRRNARARQALRRALTDKAFDYVVLRTAARVWKRARRRWTYCCRSSRKTAPSRSCICAIPTSGTTTRASPTRSGITKPIRRFPKSMAFRPLPLRSRFGTPSLTAGGRPSTPTTARITPRRAAI